MGQKKCIICGAEAKFCIKGTSDCYCEECAEENFSDISMLVAVEEEVQTLKRLVDEKIDENNQDEEDSQDRSYEDESE